MCQWGGGRERERREDCESKEKMFLDRAWIWAMCKNKGLLSNVTPSDGT